MAVVGWADRIVSRTFPNWSSLHQLMGMPSFLEKVSPDRQKSIGSMTFRCISVAFEIIRQAQQCGDLSEDAPPAEQILSGVMSMAKGAHLLEEGKDRFPPDAGIQPLEMLETNYHIYLDGTGWKPLRTEFNYAATEERIKAEVFADELAELDAR